METLQENILILRKGGYQTVWTITPFEIFVLNSVLKLLGNLKTWITSRLVYVLLIAQFVEQDVENKICSQEV